MRLVGNTHLVAGGTEMIPATLSLLQGEGIETRGNPDVYVRAYQSFGIGEARELRERSAARALGPRRVFIIATPGMTTEAQNALLKTLEEPRGDALFFFIVPSPQALLSTLRSRAQTLILKSAADKGLVDARQFLAATAKRRLDMLKPLLEKDEDERRDLGAILAFLSSLERALNDAHSVPPEGSRTSCHEGIESVYRARKFIADKGALVKPLLEQVALLAPVVKSST